MERGAAQRLPLPESPEAGLPFQIVPGHRYSAAECESLLRSQEAEASLWEDPEEIAVLILEPPRQNSSAASSASQHPGGAKELHSSGCRSSLNIQSYRCFSVLEASATAESDLERLFTRISALPPEQPVVVARSTTVFDPQLLFLLAKLRRERTDRLVRWDSIELSPRGQAAHRIAAAPLDPVLHAFGRFDQPFLTTARALHEACEWSRRAGEPALFLWRLEAGCVGSDTVLPLCLSLGAGNGFQLLEKQLHSLPPLHTSEISSPMLEAILVSANAERETEVQIIIPFRDAAELTARAVRSLEQLEGRFQVTLVDNDSGTAELSRLKQLIEVSPLGKRIELISVEGAFNFAKLNNAGASRSRSPYLLLMNNDVELTDPLTLKKLLRWCTLPFIGACGAVLRYPDGGVQHGGIELTAHAPENLHTAPPTPRAVDGVTFALALLKREAFDRLSGLDELICPNGYGDMLFCHRLKELGLLSVITPEVEAIHSESRSRPIVPGEWDLYQLMRAGVPVPMLEKKLFRGKTTVSAGAIPGARRIRRFAKKLFTALRG